MNRALVHSFTNYRLIDASNVISRPGRMVNGKYKQGYNSNLQRILENAFHGDSADGLLQQKDQSIQDKYTDMES